jgi:hypothetical protein
MSGHHAILAERCLDRRSGVALVVTVCIIVFSGPIGFVSLSRRRRPKSNYAGVCEGDPVGRPVKYPEQFRRDALKLVASSGRPIAEVARSLGIAEDTL